MGLAVKVGQYSKLAAKSDLKRAESLAKIFNDINDVLEIY